MKRLFSVCICIRATLYLLFIQYFQVSIYFNGILYSNFQNWASDFHIIIFLILNRIDWFSIMTSHTAQRRERQQVQCSTSETNRMHKPFHMVDNRSIMIKSQQQNQRIHIFFMWRWILFSSKCLFSNKLEKNEVFQLDNDLSFIRCNCCCNKWKKKNKRHHSAIAINIYGIAIDSNRHTFSYGSIGSLQVIIQEWDFD